MELNKNKEFNFSTTNFDMNEKEVQCPHCRFRLMYHQHKSAYEVHQRYEKFMNDIAKMPDAIIDELQDFFPDTPIKDYFKMKRNDLMEALNMLVKKDELTEVEKIKLEFQESEAKK